MEHGNRSGCLDNRCEYLSHRISSRQRIRCSSEVLSTVARTGRTTTGDCEGTETKVERSNKQRKLLKQKCRMEQGR